MVENLAIEARTCESVGARSNAFLSEQNERKYFSVNNNNENKKKN